MRKNGYDFYLDKCLLPIAPSKLQLKINNANSTLTLINEGQINILKTPELTDIEFECEIPQVKYPFAVYKNGFKRASYFLDYFEDLKIQKRPFQFIVSRVFSDEKKFFSTNIKVSMEDYTVTEDANNGTDLTVKINLKQYREYGAQMVKLVESDSGTKAAVEKTRAQSTVGRVKRVMLGSDVIVNGRLHRDSYGAGPGAMRTNYRGKVNFINVKGSCPYHITTPSGEWLGWVAADCVQEV